MANTQTTKLINSAYDALDRLNDVSMSHYRDKIYALSETGERQHRKGSFGKGRYNCTVATAAKLFTVRWLTQYATQPDKLPSLKEALSIRDDIVLAAMVAANYRDIILTSLQGIDTTQILAIDYVALVEGRAP